MNELKNISARDGIERLRDYCKEHNYQIKTTDPTFQNYYLIEYREPQQTGVIEDNYTVTRTAHGTEITVTFGTLLEVLHDLKLIDDYERIDPNELITQYGTFRSRSTSISPIYRRR